MTYEIKAVARREQAELERREHVFFGNLPPLDFAGKTVIVVDDGPATGATMAAAIAVIRRHQPARIVLAVPVASPEACERFREIVDELVCLEMPDPFGAIGYWYADFAQVSNGEVARTLHRLRARAVA